MKKRVLVVDDEASMREFLSILLEREGLEVDVAENAASALQLIEGAYDLVISDVKMPGLDGISLLRSIKATSPATEVLMVTAFSTTEQAVEAMKLGAYDYISKPFKVDEVKLLVRNALEKSELRKENSRLREQVSRAAACGSLIGKSSKMAEVYDLIRKAGPSTANILILGESGTGKELAAKAVHIHSPRKDNSFVAVNCGAIPEALIESEFFGHKKGSFTGAIADKPGLFEQANGGTLFLDEIGEIPLLLQAKLLRVLQEREVRRVGAVDSVKIDVRIVAASNRNLEEQVREGTFREDLFYRLNVVQMTMPPLRDRPEDIPLLIHEFHRKFSHPGTGRGEAASPGALKLLMRYPFPGNVRELENIVERCMVLGGAMITEDSLPVQVRDFDKGEAAQHSFVIPSDGMNLENYLDGIEKGLLLQALEKAHGVKKRAAEILGLSFRSFRYRLAKFDMDED
ncbi:MAG TPA: sigma-54 dependent transcriptional regulator [Verrucomicrobiae bacterium]|nr:sigma-54 dependent transcriptional regulator [Verrucomicrobiae bacterium]